MVQLTSSFNGLPQIPFTSFRLTIAPFFFNAPTCGTRNAEAAKELRPAFAGRSSPQRDTSTRWRRSIDALSEIG